MKNNHFLHPHPTCTLHRKYSHIYTFLGASNTLHIMHNSILHPHSPSPFLFIPVFPSLSEFTSFTLTPNAGSTIASTPCSGLPHSLQHPKPPTWPTQNFKSHLPKTFLPEVAISHSLRNKKITFANMSLLLCDLKEFIFTHLHLKYRFCHSYRH